MMETIEKKHQIAVLGLGNAMLKNEKLATPAIKLPQEIRQYGVVNVLMKYHNKSEVLEPIENQVWIFLETFGFEKPTKMPTEQDNNFLLRKIELLNNLPVRLDMLLNEHLLGYAEELRKVVKILNND